MSPRGDERAQDRLLQISLRLKAARWLAGRRSDDGKRALPLGQDELAALDAVALNRISKNRIEDYEQMELEENKIVPMELELIAEALGLPRNFITEGLEPDPAQARLDAIESRVAAIQKGLEIADILGEDPTSEGSRGGRSRSSKRRPRQREGDPSAP